MGHSPKISHISHAQAQTRRVFLNHFKQEIISSCMLFWFSGWAFQPNVKHSIHHWANVKLRSKINAWQEFRFMAGAKCKARPFQKEKQEKPGTLKSLKPGTHRMSTTQTSSRKSARRRENIRRRSRTRIYRWPAVSTPPARCTTRLPSLLVLPQNFRPRWKILKIRLLFGKVSYR